MPKSKQSELDDLFRRADAAYEKGEMKSAFRSFLAAAKRGDAGCQINLGNLYADGKSVKPNHKAAMYWYLKAYRQGATAAAHNIGMMLRDEGKFDRAIAWLRREGKGVDGDASLDIAKIYLHNKNDKTKAIHYLKQALGADRRYMFPESMPEARKLLRDLAVKTRKGNVPKPQSLRGYDNRVRSTVPAPVVDQFGKLTATAETRSLAALGMTWVRNGHEIPRCARDDGGCALGMTREEGHSRLN
jgi:tetratricopeptide (TPR) repeat protein